MVLEAIAGGLASGLGGGLFGSLFGDSPPGPKDILNAQAEVLAGLSEEAIARIQEQGAGFNDLSQEFLSQYVSDASRKGFQKDAKSYANSLFNSAKQGGISFADAGNRFMTAALTAGIRPGDELKGGRTLSDYARDFDTAAREWAPFEWERSANTASKQLLGRSLTKNEINNVYKFGTMTDTEMRDYMARNTYEGFSRNHQNVPDAASSWYFGGRAVYPTANSRFDKEENREQRQKLDRIA
jgi:hypothetical protein